MKQQFMKMKRSRQEKKQRRDDRKRHKRAKLYAQLTQRRPFSKNVAKHPVVVAREEKEYAAAEAKGGLKRILEREDGDLVSAGAELLEWICGGLPKDEFFSRFSELKPLLVRNSEGNESRFNGIESTGLIKWRIENGKLKYNRDMSLSVYQDGLRRTLHADLEEVAELKSVWADFEGGASLRLLRPHEHNDVLWKMISCLEAFFNAGGGSNAYLTPSESQGFAPHYDDIDAFILQVEGSKNWTVYDTFDGSEEKDDDNLESRFPKHPRHSSGDFSRQNVSKLEVALKTTLSPGDMLYIPRGMVHEAKSTKDSHSLHVTISMAQRMTWADYLAEALPHAVQRACLSDSVADCASLRRNLPRDMSEFMGIINSDNITDTRREDFVKNVVEHVNLVLQNIDFDIIADRMAVRFQEERTKPAELGKLGEDETPKQSVEKLSLNSEVELAFPGVATLTVEGDAAILYHSCQNTRVHREAGPRGLEFDLEDAEALEQILRSKPRNPFAVKTLTHPGDDDDKLRIARFLVTEGVLRLCE